MNCGGLHSDVIAKKCGIDPDIKIIPFRGEYYKLAPEKEYLVKMQTPLTGSEIERITTGQCIDGAVYRLRSVKLASMTQRNAWYVIIATEGKNRMIRKLAESIGHRVLRLRRVRIGPVLLGSLRPGMWRHLRPAEIEQIIRRTTDA